MKYSKKYYIKNRKNILLKKRRYYRKNRKKLIAKQSSYYVQNLKAIKEYKKKYRRKNKIKIRIAKRHYKYAKRKTDLLFRLKDSLRNRIYCAVRYNQKSGSAVKDLGCSISEFKKYTESKFYGKMSWNNWGTIWQLDHIVPLWKFNLSNRNQFKQAAHYTNLQPLTIEDHKEKSKKDVNIW